MGIFGNKTEKKEAAKKDAPAVAAPQGVLREKDLSTVIIKPRITEKGMGGSDSAVYVFEIARSATKYDVRDAVKQIWKVTPRKVHIVQNQPRQTMSRARSRKMIVKGLKKAYVYLKKGDKIDLV